MLLFVAQVYVITLLNAETFVINVDQLGPYIPNEFIGVTLDAYLANDWNDFEFYNTKMNTIAKNFGKTIFRYSGTNADDTFYNISHNSNDNSNNKQQINGTQFKQLSDFAARNGWDFIFGINAANERLSNGEWDPTNAKALISNIKDDTSVYAFELGNEPEWYQSQGWNTVNASQITEDIKTFYDLLESEYGTGKAPLIFGPDTTQLDSWLNEYTKDMKGNGYDFVKHITWHHYFDSGTDWTINDFMNVTIMDSLIHAVNDSIEIVRDNLGENYHVILGETNSQWNAPTNLSQSFVSGFMWLDKLGLSGSLGLYGCYRQCFWNYKVGFIGTDYNINPDYWSSYLFKNLVGNNAIMVDNQFNYGRYLRVYAFCTRTNNGSIFNYSAGSITIVYININNNNEIIDLNFNGYINNSTSYYDVYHLTPYNSMVNSRSIYLNNIAIEMPNDETMPDLNHPIKINYGSSIQVKSQSYGFIVIANANDINCI